METYTFNDFMEAVSNECESSLGCSALDLPDYPYREDWETCESDLAFIAPEDTVRQRDVFRQHVSYTMEDLMNECNMDANPYAQGVDY